MESSFITIYNPWEKSAHEFLIPKDQHPLLPCLLAFDNKCKRAWLEEICNHYPLLWHLLEPRPPAWRLRRHCSTTPHAPRERMEATLKMKAVPQGGSPEQRGSSREPWDHSTSTLTGLPKHVAKAKFPYVSLKLGSMKFRRMGVVLNAWHRLKPQEASLQPKHEWGGMSVLFIPNKSIEQMHPGVRSKWLV